MRSNFMAGAWIVGITHIFAAMLLAGNASARACMTSGGCPHGFECSGGACVSLTCQSNADCAPGLPCRPDTQCVASADGSSIPSGACVPQWQALCNVDSDCGSGFQCIFAGGACDCSGSDTNVPPDAGVVSLPCEEVMPPRPPCANANDAGCPSFPSVCDAGSSCLCWGIARICQQKQMPSCGTNAECLSGWACMCPPDANGSPTAGCSKSCQPPNWDLAFQGPLGSGTLVCGSGAMGGPALGNFGPGGGSPGAGNGTPTASGSTATGGTSAKGSGGCEIGIGRTTAPWLSAFFLSLVGLGGVRRRAHRPGTR